MRAARLVARGHVEVARVPIPEPGPRQALIRMRRASICGSDVHVVFDGFEPDELPAAPGYPGHEGVGEVVESRSTMFAPGDCVLTVPVPGQGGCFAEFQLVDEASLVALQSEG